MASSAFAGMGGIASFAPIAMLRSAFLVLLLCSIFVQAHSDEPVASETHSHASEAHAAESSSPVTTTDSHTPSTTTPTVTALTTVVSVYYLNVRGEDQGLPFTAFYRVGGSVVGVDSTATTFVVTATLSDQRQARHTRTDNMTTNIPTLRRNTHSWHLNMTQKPSTITQGPSTFLYTGTDFGPGRTLINRCSLNGTSSASCNLTHVGDGWYTRDDLWDGVFSTYNYSWTSGDRFGFAPVTLTAGVEKLPPPTAAVTTSTSAGAGGMPRGMQLEEAYWLGVTSAVFGACVLGIFAVL